MAVKGRKVIAVLLVAASVSTAASSEVEVPNWVSPINATDDSCYRKMYLSTETCAKGYESDGIASCWAQCGLTLPVECGSECIQQGADCTSQILGKVTSVATVALNAATAGVFGQLVKASKALELGVKCGQALFAATSSLVGYVGELRDTETQNEQLLSVVNQSDLVINELPTAVCTCLNLPVSTDNLALTAEVVDTVGKIVMEVVDDGASLLDPSTFLAFMGDVGVDDSVQDLDADSLTQLQGILTTGTSCGTKLQTITHKVTQFVAAILSDEPGSTVSTIRQALSVSKLFLEDVPVVTNDCSQNVTDDAFSVRDSLRTVMSTITDGLADAAVDDDGNAISKSDYLLSVADMGLDVIGTLDPTGIVDMMSTFIQPICGPTAFVGKIDDGSLEDALALTTEGEAFNGSYGTWSNSGDGTVKITFKSADTEDVTVDIHSGGDTVAEVKVPSGKTVSWKSTVKKLQDKTLYMDRSRPGLLDVPVSSGGSLLLWVPRPSAKGMIELFVKINGEEGDDSKEDSSETDIEQNDNQTGSGDDANATPSPTTPKDEDPTQQMPMSKAGAATPIPTSPKDEDPTQQMPLAEDVSTTPAPTTPKDEDPTQQMPMSEDVAAPTTSEDENPTQKMPMSEDVSATPTPTSMVTPAPTTTKRSTKGNMCLRALP